MRRLPSVVFSSLFATLTAQDLPLVEGIEGQPLFASVLRLTEALEFIGSPLDPRATRRIEALKDSAIGPELIRAVQEVLDPYCLALVDIGPRKWVRVSRGPAKAELMQGGWRSFLVKIRNRAGTPAKLHVLSPNSRPVVHIAGGRSTPHPAKSLDEDELADRFLEAQFYHRRPMNPLLSGLGLEYAILQLYTRERGEREARIAFDLWEEPNVEPRQRIDLVFSCVPSVKVVFGVKDFDGKPTTASFTITDGIDRRQDPPHERGYRLNLARLEAWDSRLSQGRQPGSPSRTRENVPSLNRLRGIYPLPSRRVASRDEFPDFYFQPQIYRADGEHVYLPPGIYDVTYSRGPEYLQGTRRITVPTGVETHEELFELQRWTHLAALGWYSADHHVHAAGCSHYESPEAGVDPAAMFRQALGEDLNISCVLTWGPCWDHQKSFFEGTVSELSTAANLIRYDVEVSGFPSGHAGHLCLLRLSEDDYPDAKRIEDWPSWTLPIMRWAKDQGGVVGYAHSGFGLEPIDQTTKLPNLSPVPFDGIGANEYIVTWVHGACDFIGIGNTPALHELNIWYHTLNCGARTRIAGETDFPCIFDERIGMARSYARLEGTLDFDEFADQLRAGCNYVSDGRSHLIDFQVDDAQMGENGSELRLSAGTTVKIRAKVTALLPQKRDRVGAFVARRGGLAKPHWHLEKARIGDSRRVLVELVEGGQPVASQEIEADGEWRNIEFDHRIDHSSWVALRIYQSSHTNPVFVLVNEKPIRISRASAEWCRSGVDRCWESKSGKIRKEESAAAKAAYDFARRYYERVAAEAVRD